MALGMARTRLYDPSSSIRMNGGTSMATTAETLQAFDQLTPNEQKEVATRIAQIAVRSLGDPSAATTNRLWYIVVGTFSALILGGLAALVVLVWTGKPTAVIAPLVTLGAGVLGGLLAPNPK